MKSIIADETELKKIEAILLPKSCSFENDARAVINCWESREVSACAGSGKTTVLLAKLKILADRMPFNDNSGVCVLSHTNVAVNEIKTRLPDCSDKLIRYPNYVGTIQSFIDQFIVIPYLKTKTKNPLQVLDDDTYAKQFWRMVASNRKYYTLKGLIIRKTKQSHYSDYCAVIKDLYISSEDHGLYLKNLKKLLAGSTTASAREFNDAKEELLQIGTIRYNDAYQYAKEAIETLPGDYIDLFSSRFQYVFVDEYQDCDEIQRKVLAKLFDKTKCMVMYIGDPDQAIYNYDQKIEEWIPVNPLSIEHSCRYGQEIADVISPLRCTEGDIRSSLGALQYKPTLIVYDDESICQVIPTFINVLDENSLTDPNSIYKVIGAIKKQTLKGRKIGDYWEAFNSEYSKAVFKTYWEMIDDICVELNKGRLYAAETCIMKLLCQIARFGKETDTKYSVPKLRDYICDKYYKNYASAIYKLLECPEFNRNTVDLFFHGLIDSLSNSENAASSIYKHLPSFFFNPEEKGAMKRYKEDINKFVEPEHGRTIYFDTIHGVKGETHDATLYLETEKGRVSDIKSILPYYIEGMKKKGNNYNRKLAYVGMSRPRKLLCLAISENTYDCGKEAFNEWSIKRCEKFCDSDDDV